MENIDKNTAEAGNLSNELIGGSAEVNGIKINYLMGGNPEGSPVLLWHGFLGTSSSWRKAASILIDAGLAVLIPDMRGYGDSDKPQGTIGYDARTISEDFRALVKKLDFGKGKPITLAAHDMGAAPALIWSADHPQEIASLFYIEMVVMLDQVLSPHLSFTRETMESQMGPMWWWILPHAPKALEVLFTGREREFLTWFYDWMTAGKDVIDSEQIEEIYRTFSGNNGFQGAFGIYRGVFDSIDQTAPLVKNKIKVPVFAIGGAYSLGAGVGEMTKLVAENVTPLVIENAGHFLPEEKPQEIAQHIINSL
ncbi:Soluble epoxide hydrolase [compost metagenome]